jgi:hypothetical protein
VLESSGSGQGISFVFTMGPSKSDPGKQVMCCVKCKGELQPPQIALFTVIAKLQVAGEGNCPHCGKSLLSPTGVRVYLAPSKSDPNAQGFFCPECKEELEPDQLAAVQRAGKAQLHAKPQAAGASPSSEQAGGGNCFVATAAFGSVMQPEVRLLRRFRDERLAKFAAGRAFIRAYNSFGPALAAVVRRSGARRALSRAAICAACALLLRLDGAKPRTAENSNSEV